MTTEQERADQARKDRERDQQRREREHREATAVDKAKGERREQDGLDQRRVQRLEAVLASGDPRELRRAGGAGSPEYAEAAKRVNARATAAARGRAVADDASRQEQAQQGRRPAQQSPAQRQETLREQTVRRQQELAAQRARDKDRSLGR